MILNDECYETMDKNIVEFSQAISGQCNNVSSILKDLAKLVKKSDKMDMDSITLILMYIIDIIKQGDDGLDLTKNVLCDLHGDILGWESAEKASTYRGPIKGETAMTNKDGSYVTLKELGIDD